MLEKALEIASRITHPIPAAAFAAVLAVVVLISARRKGKPSTPEAVWIILAIGIIVLGIAPLAASTYLQTQGIYRVRLVVLDPDGLPASNADVTSSVGGEPTAAKGRWEFIIPPKTRPADGSVTFIASVRSAFLTGSSTLILAEDYFPTRTIQLTADTSAVVRGVVLDARGMSVADADVSIPGYSDAAVTDKMGNFSLPAHVADGQIVQVRAQKGRLVGSMSVPAGSIPVQIVIKHP